MHIQNLISCLPNFRQRGSWMYGLAMMLTLGMTTAGSAEAIAAKFIHSFTYPGNEAQVLDPGNVYFDARQEETFVTDTRNWRILIFDKRGRYSFDFRDVEHLAGARQVCVDSLGRIYVLRANPESVISVFEYNGQYLREMHFSSPGTHDTLTISGFGLDERDRMYILAVQPLHVYTVTTDGEALSDFAIFADDTTVQNNPVFGTMALVKGNLVIPVPMLGMIARYTTEGQSLGFFGTAGGGPGELSFPVAVAGDTSGNLYVLDKHRHTILQYDATTKYIRDIGGRGSSPGWFYHPTCLAICSPGEAVVGQGYLGRVQLVGLNGPDSGTGDQIQK